MHRFDLTHRYRTENPLVGRELGEAMIAPRIAPDKDYLINRYGWHCNHLGFVPMEIQWELLDMSGML
jgi:hypothetical protein